MKPPPHSKRHARPVACAILALAVCLSLPAGGMPAQELPALVASGARVERIVRGFAFVEGPAADADGALSSRPGHGNWFVASSSATRRNTGVG